WGRVVTEAQFSGIPVITSDRGGLPESVGPGGIVLPHNAPTAIWADTIATLWSNPGHYSQLSQAALQHAARADLDPDRQIAKLIEMLSQLTAPPSA
ncbi:MAG TPA: glycosyltransferase, partial [Stellaceae bacterium]|nr:glycosyltransferase [Stellaceae bacterium]